MRTPVVRRHHLDVLILPTTIGGLALDADIRELDVVVHHWQGLLARPLGDLFSAWQKVGSAMGQGGQQAGNQLEGMIPWPVEFQKGPALLLLEFDTSAGGPETLKFTNVGVARPDLTKEIWLYPRAPTSSSSTTFPPGGTPPALPPPPATPEPKPEAKPEPKPEGGSGPGGGG